MSTWHGSAPPEPRVLGLGDWVRVVSRAVPLLVLLGVCFPLLLVLRLPERLFFGLNRPLTPYLTQFVCLQGCRILGLKRVIRGGPMPERGAFVANHVSWLDIFVLNASKRLYFVAKSEVRGWGGIGWLARGTGTVFINRDRREARAQMEVFEARLNAGHKLLFFPEGTSTDGKQVLPFKTTLFAAFFTQELREFLHIQPVSLRYVAPEDEDPLYYGWWGEMAFGPNLLQMLAAERAGRVEITYHAPLRVSDFPDRKALALACEEAVRSGVIAVVR